MAVKFKDYYETLGVKREASEKEIKDAYRKQARRYHPDVNPGAKKKESEEKFKEINEAYEVLGDPKKRSKYDQFGANWKEGMDFTPPPGARSPSERFEFDFDTQEGLGGFSDFFQAFFGRGGAGFGTRTARGGVRGTDGEAEMGLTLEEAIRGGSRRVRLTVQAVCPFCGGKGRIDQKVCPTCGGVGFVPETKEITVNIPPGARDGVRIRLTGQGGAGTGGAPAGDLLIQIHLLPDPRFTVSGDDLIAELAVYPWGAVLGGSFEVETLDGRVKLKVPPESQAGQQFRLREKGLPRAGGKERGDLFVRLKIVVPTGVTPDERSLFEKLAHLRGKTPHAG